MSEVATFFRNRTSDSGETYQIEIGSASVSVYARKPIQSDLAKLAQAPDTELALKDLRSFVANEGGGGFIVRATDERGVRNLTVTRIGGKAFEPADQFVMLSPGRMSGFLPADGKNNRVPLSSHAIVPVDEEALNELDRFIGHLSWLSPDLESLVLNAIRRPSLESRLNKLETKVFGQSLSEASGPGFFAAIKDALNRWMSPIMQRVTIVVLLVLVAIGAIIVFVPDILSKVKPSSGTDSSASSTAPATDTSSTATDTSGEAVSEDMYVAEARKLFSALRDRHGAKGEAKRDAKNIAITKLYDAHFEVLNNPLLTEAEIKALFSQYDASAELPEDIKPLFDRYIVTKDDGSVIENRNKPFLWGMIKLQALTLDPSLKCGKCLEDWKAWTDTKVAFRKIGTIIEKDSARNFLAVMACRLDSPPVPALPKYPPSASADDSEHAAYEFIQKGDCGTLTPANIKAGLEALTTWVDKQ